jgi:hypothetical protein
LEADRQLGEGKNVVPGHWENGRVISMAVLIAVGIPSTT